MKNTIFKNEEIYNDFSRILWNTKFWLKKYWFKRVEFEKKLLTIWKIQRKTALKLLKVYNDYYNLDLKLNNVFKTNKLLNKKEKLEVNFTFVNDWNSGLFNVVDNILSLIGDILVIFSIKDIPNDNKNELKYNEEFPWIRWLFLFTIVIIFIYSFYMYNNFI